jgi:hypothetical protein
VTTVTCTDASGPSCQFTVDVDDLEPPVVGAPPAQQVGTDAPACTALINYPPPTYADNCPGGGALCVPPSGSIFPLGVTTVTCTGTDASNNTGSSTTTMTVVDDDPPAVTAPDLVVPTDPGVCTGTATPTPLGVSDNCPGVNASCVPPGPTWPLGVNPILCTATDGAGNQTSDDGSVTVNDLEAPILTCPADIVEDLDPGVTEGVVNWLDPLVADNCPNPGAPTCVPPSGSLFPGGETTPVNCSALDASGNSGTCSFTVTLNLVSILEIPTASTWGLAALALLLAGAAFLALRRNA